MEESKSQMTTARVVAGYEIFFVWSGGPYIEIGWTRSGSSPFDVINVWDYAKGARAIPFTREAFKAAVSDYVNNPEVDHAHDLAEYARY